jgi:hypothetical protein
VHKFKKLQRAANAEQKGYRTIDSNADNVTLFHKVSNELPGPDNLVPINSTKDYAEILIYSKRCLEIWDTNYPDIRYPQDMREIEL